MTEQDWVSTRFDAARAERDRATYQGGQPWPHIVIDDFLPKDLAEAALAEFPAETDPVWDAHGRRYDNAGVASKMEMAKIEHAGPALRNVLASVNSPAFVRYVETISGIKSLRADPSFLGGGLNLVGNGGFLEVHADFNFHNELQSYRAVNLLIYLNPGWELEHGGALELWDEGMKGPPGLVVPSFNRGLLFTTNSTSYHGYGKVNHPQGHARRSLNIYYWAPEAPAGVHSDAHKTIWKPGMAQHHDHDHGDGHY